MSEKLVKVSELIVTTFAVDLPLNNMNEYSQSIFDRQYIDNVKLLGVKKLWNK